MTSRDLVTVAEAAQLMHVSTRTVRRWIHEGDLPAVKIGPAANDRILIPVDALTDRLRVVPTRTAETP